MSASFDPRWEMLLPAEFRARVAALPVVFLPLGTVEWHGEHNALGLDSLKAHGLCIASAQRAGGGIVHPPIYGGMGGLDRPATVQIEPEMAPLSELLRPWLVRLCEEFHRLGFRAILMLTGHYGHNQQIVVREVAAEMSERLSIPVLGVPEYWLAHDLGYLGDHAGIGETSLMMHLYPELVKIDRIRSDPDYGRTPEIENGSSPEIGRRYAETIVDRLARLAIAMPTWDAEKRSAFIAAERALAAAQREGWQKHEPWHAWKRQFDRKLYQYGQWLVEERFDKIAEMAKLIRE
jgi:creatinine amidohydrolase